MAISTITKVGKHLHSIFKCDPRSQQEGVDGGDSDADFVAAPNENPRSQQEGVEGGDSDADFVAALNETRRYTRWNDLEKEAVLKYLKKYLNVRSGDQSIGLPDSKRIKHFLESNPHLLKNIESPSVRRSTVRNLVMNEQKRRVNIAKNLFSQ